MRTRTAAIAAAVLLVLVVGAGWCSTEDTTSPTTSAPPTADETPVEEVEFDTEESGGGEVSQGLGSQDASGDVTDVTIVWSDNEFLPMHEVTAKVTNNSEKRSNYSITIAIESPDGAVRYEETYLYVDGLESGQTTTEKTLLFEEDTPRDAVAVVKKVERLASS